ncbi:PTS transporter subunit EIIC [Lacticaseibacillus camelliae]|uniref:PTS transporter subunit EIIC n=1 Tax=Lacticaseibacillus camelliae TaxID=381742 RepID=UPI000B2DF693|nr:PTS transporter subunit EIIC [Lacticaseibacillus camelliae]
MQKFMDWLQNTIMPPMAKVGNNKYLVSIRNGLVLTLPAIISGSVFMILANIPIPAWTRFIKPYVNMMGVATNASFGIISLLAVIGISFQLAKALDVDAISAAGLGTMRSSCCRLTTSTRLIPPTSRHPVCLLPLLPRLSLF